MKVAELALGRVRERALWARMRALEDEEAGSRAAATNVDQQWGRGGVSCIGDVLVRVEEGHGDAMHDRRGVERERAEPLVLDFALDLDQVGSTVVRTMERVSLDACSPDATRPHAFEPE